MSGLKTFAAEAQDMVVSVAAMQHLEAEAFRSGRLSSLQAMETAGAGVAAAILADPLAERRAVVLAGPGNNGGDGYVVARLLHEAGWSLSLLALSAPGAGAPDAQTNAAAWATRGPIGDLLTDLPEVLAGPRPGVLVDALFGIGLSRGITGALAEAFLEIESQWPMDQVHRVAVDLPSGLGGDDDLPLGAVLPAHVSVTFHRPKRAHIARPDLCGEVLVVDIGL